MREHTNNPNITTYVMSRCSEITAQRKVAHLIVMESTQQGAEKQMSDWYFESVYWKLEMLSLHCNSKPFSVWQPLSLSILKSWLYGLKQHTVNIQLLQAPSLLNCSCFFIYGWFICKKACMHKHNTTQHNTLWPGAYVHIVQYFKFQYEIKSPGEFLNTLLHYVVNREEETL